MEQRKKNRSRYLPVLFAILGSIVFVNLFSGTDYRFFSLMVKVHVLLGGASQTRLVLPPVGEIRAHTHWFPVQLTAELRSVDLNSLRHTVFSPLVEDGLVPELVQKGAVQIILHFLLKQVFLALLGAICGLFVLGVRRPRRLLQGGLAAMMVLLIIVGVVYSTYNLEAFERVEYEGMIEAAPWVLSMVRDALAQVEELGQRVQNLASNLYSALQRLEELGPVGLVEADVLVLHVSDIHNNPVAYNFAAQVVENFGVDVILDTGDLTDWGTALEAEITKRIERLGLPYIFVSGNHDSPQVVQRLLETPHAVVLGPPVTIAGLHIAGAGDLVAGSYLPTPASQEELAALAEEINTTWEEREEKPHIFLVHNHRVAEAITPGLFPVVAYGHTHLWGVRQVDGTVYSNAGTTGAAGIRGFQSKEPLPYSLSLLYFVRDEAGNLRLEAVDGVHVTGLGQSFSLQRTFVEHGRNSGGNVELTL